MQKAIFLLVISMVITGCSETESAKSVTNLSETYPDFYSQFSEKIDLENLDNYADQSRPAYISLDNTEANPITNSGATLGRILFYDTNLSSSNTVSCSSCHAQGTAFSDTDLVSVGVNGNTGRHSMRLINSRFSSTQTFFWDERAATLEAQTTQPIQDHNEMGFSGTMGDDDFSGLITKLSAIGYYTDLFTFVYGDSAITENRIQLALAQFIRSIQSFDSKYDTGRAQAANDGVDFSNFSEDENAGKKLFLDPPPAGGAGCAGCHRPPEFSIDPNTLSNGVVGVFGGGTDTTVTRSPTLRDIFTAAGELNGALMHDASMLTIEAVIDHYDSGITNTTNLDPRLRPGGSPQNLGLTAQEKAQLAAFIKTLSGTSVYTDPKWSSPFE